MDEQLKSLITDQSANNDPIDFMEYWRIVDRFKWRIILFSATVTILAVIYSLSMVPQYSSTVKLMIESDKANMVSIREIYEIDENQRDYYLTQFEILKSRQLIRNVIRKLDLLNKADFNKLQNDVENGSETIFNKSMSFLNLSSNDNREDLSKDRIEQIATRLAVDFFLERLTFEPIPRTKLVNITFDSADPQLSAEVANTLAEMYIQNYLDVKLEKTNIATSWMNNKQSETEKGLAIAEKKLKEFYEREDLINYNGISGPAQQKLDDLISRHLGAERKVQETKAIYDLSRTNGLTLDEIANIPSVMDNSILQQARTSVLNAEQTVLRLSKRYGPRHLKMIAARTDLNSTQESFNEQVKKLISGIATEYQSARTQERELSILVEKAKNELQRLRYLERENTNLQDEVDRQKQILNKFAVSISEQTATSGFQTPNARILDRAQVPLWPSKPVKKKIVGIAMIAAFIFAIALAFLHDFLSAGIRSVDDIERKLRQRMLGIIPLQKLDKGEELANDVFFDKNSRGFSEAVRTIRTSLLMSQMETPQKIISITSSIPGEGKSTLSTNLAVALGQMEKVLLIDADLRRPSLGKRFGYPSYQPGLSNLIAKSASLSSCIITDQKTNIDLMLAGAVPPNPQELLSTDLVVTALKLLSAKYDRIIIDTAPTQAVSDALIISSYADTTIYVVKSDSTHIKTVKSGLGRLLQIGSNVAGVVLNQVNLEESAKYGDYAGYYDHYGYTSDEIESDEEEIKFAVNQETLDAKTSNKEVSAKKKKDNKIAKRKETASKKAEDKKLAKEQKKKESEQLSNSKKVEAVNKGKISISKQSSATQRGAAVKSAEADKKIHSLVDEEEKLVAPPTFK